MEQFIGLLLILLSCHVHHQGPWIRKFNSFLDCPDSIHSSIQIIKSKEDDHCLLWMLSEEPVHPSSLVDNFSRSLWLTMNFSASLEKQQIVEMRMDALDGHQSKKMDCNNESRCHECCKRCTGCRCKFWFPQCMNSFITEKYVLLWYETFLI